MRRFLVLLMLLTGCQKIMPLPLLNGFPKNSVPIYPVTATGNKIIILGGQSNMLGRGQSSPFAAYPNVVLEPAGNTLTGPGVYAGDLLSKAYPNWKVTLVECAIGSTYISQWVKGGDHYRPCIDMVKAAQAQGGTIVGMFFYQGENDGRDILTLDWAAQFESMVRDMRSDLGVPNMPVVFAQIAYDSLPIPDLQNNWRALQAEQASVYMTNVTMVKTQDVAHVVDDVHLDEQSCMSVGDRFEKAYLHYITGE